MNSSTDTAPSVVELALDAHAELGEGPVWHAAEGVLIWVDLTRHLMLALRDGFGTLDTASGRVEMIADPEADNPGNRMNDGKCDGAGQFWDGTMAYDSRPGAGALYRLQTDHRTDQPRRSSDPIRYLLP